MKNVGSVEKIFMTVHKNMEVFVMNNNRHNTKKFRYYYILCARTFLPIKLVQTQKTSDTRKRKCTKKQGNQEEKPNINFEIGGVKV